VSYARRLGLFRKDPWKDGERATATLERVLVTRETRGGTKHSLGRDVVFMTFRFTDAMGATVTHERQLTVGGNLPPPGSTVDIAYLPGDLDTIAFDENAVRPPDPAVPRGWGAGIFELEDLGTHRTGSHDLDEQRQLFRTGVRATAEVIACDWHMTGGHAREAVRHTLTLRSGNQQIETTAFMPPTYAPHAGDTIEIAVSSDGMQVALDTDERYDGPPGQCLVFTTPPDIVAARSRPIVGTEAPPPTTPQSPQALALAQLDDLWARRAITQENYEKMKANLMPATSTPGLPSAAERQLAALETAHASGAMSDEQYESLKSRLGGSY
jgi:hypothetical protein